MSQYLVLSRINIQNANAVAGFTWGFPGITHFLGFVHALDRKTSKDFSGHSEVNFTGCAIVANQVQQKIYRPKPAADPEFLQSKNPPVFAKHKSRMPSIIEEGKLNLTVSLVIELSEALMLTTEKIKVFEAQISTLAERMRIAGGTVLSIGQVKLISANTDDNRKKATQIIKRLCMPGFVLQDRREYLAEHVETLKLQSKDNSSSSNPLLLDAWMDFAALKSKAEPILKKGQSEANEQTDAEWHVQPKPFGGFLVPLMTGYKAISETYPAGEVEDTRDPETPARFVEAVHSVGEWQGMHRVKNLDDIIWRYKQEGEWYLCRQDKTDHQPQSTHEDDSEASQKSETDLLLEKF